MTSPTYIRLPGNVKRELTAACRNRLPHEACGVIFGREEGLTLAVEGFAVIRNAATEPGSRFSFSPGDWVAAYYEAHKNRRSIVGFFHSHPHGSLLPSSEDTQGWLPWGTYWIVGLTPDQETAVYRHDHRAGWTRLPFADSPS
jgi:proteasome lid subunit RPN8/RPN11